jgi:hypothetical protein
MALRGRYVFIFLTVLASFGAQARTQNFVANAPTQEIAQQIAQYAEHYRKEKALQWLGQEMPPWSEPCPIQVKVTMSGAGGATSFAFDRGQVLGQHMQIEGSLDRLLVSVLPHEVTHTVFAHYYRRPVPRWADEGGSVLSEDDTERNRHDMICRQILNTPGRAIPLRRLFAFTEYPKDVMALYAQGFSVTNFLVNASNRQAFLAFVAHGMQYGWDSACQTHYRYQNVEELEQAWLAKLRETKRPPAQLVNNTNTNNPPTLESDQRTVVRLTAPPAQPLDAPAGPVFRGANPEATPAGRPNYLPEPGPQATAPQIAMPPLQVPSPQPAAGWSPVPPGGQQPPTVQLGPPQFMSQGR